MLSVKTTHTKFNAFCSSNYDFLQLKKGVLTLMENTKGDAAQLCIIQFIHLRPETLLMVQKSGKLTSLTLGEYYYHEIQQGFTKTPSHGAWPPGIFFQPSCSTSLSQQWVISGPPHPLWMWTFSWLSEGGLFKKQPLGPSKPIGEYHGEKTMYITYTFILK